MKLGYKTIYPHGLIQQRPKFAFFPVRLSGGDLIWLEPYVVTQKFYKNSKGNGGWWDTINLSKEWN